MAPQQKYRDFVESDVVQRRCKKPPYEMESYVDITCPHCNEKCAEILFDHLQKAKSTACLKHLRVCEAFKAKGGEVSSAPDKTSELDKLKEKIASMEGDIGKIWAIMGGGDPAPTTMVELKTRLPQKVDELGTKRKYEENLSPYRNWTVKETKKFRELVHPDHEAGHSTGFQQWAEKVREEHLEANKRA